MLFYWTIFIGKTQVILSTLNETNPKGKLNQNQALSATQKVTILPRVMKMSKRPKRSKVASTIQLTSTFDSAPTLVTFFSPSFTTCSASAAVVASLRQEAHSAVIEKWSISNGTNWPLRDSTKNKTSSKWSLLAGLSDWSHESTWTNDNVKQSISSRNTWSVTKL